MFVKVCMVQEVEAAISLLFETGEAATEEMTQSNCGALGPLALGAFSLIIPVPNSFQPPLLLKDLILKACCKLPAFINFASIVKERDNNDVMKI